MEETGKEKKLQRLGHFRQEGTGKGSRIGRRCGEMKKIYQELVAIRKELQAIRSILESLPKFTIEREPYGRTQHVVMKPYYKGQ